MKNKFPASHRLKKSEEFRTVMTNGERKVLRDFIVYLLPNNLNHPRLGVTVSKRVGKAHVRNRLKRLLREYFRLHQDKLNSFDIVIIAKKVAGSINYRTMAEELTLIFNF
jgi:ribonuclease P protein component